MQLVKNRHELHFILLLILAGLYLSYLIYAPFFYDFIIAASSAAIMRPLFVFLQKRLGNHERINASLVTILLSLIILGPTTLLVTSITTESLSTYNLIRGEIQSGNLEKLFQIQQYPWIQDAYNFVGQYVDIKTIDLKAMLAEQITQFSLWIYQGGTDLLTSISLLLVHLFFILLMFFFLVRDSGKIMEEIGKFTPISSQNLAILSQKFTDVSQAILNGTFLTAMAQGLMLGIGFAILGVQGPVFWGFITSFLALIPVAGTFIIWFPACVILLVSGAYIKALIMLLWGVFIVSTIDNIIRPYVMKNKAHLPGIVIFFAVIGGLTVFGAIGIITGPMITVFLFTLLEMYGQKLKMQEIPETTAGGKRQGPKV